jgi:hypothetical protein
MAQERILLDPSGWIYYFRPQGWEDLKAAVQRALSEGRISTCWVVKAEVLVGAKDEESFVTLLDNLRALPKIPVTGKLWEAAARLGHSMQRQGLTIPLPDLLIAQAAMEGNLVLWHIDEHFERMSRYSPLQTRSFLP